MHSVWRITTGVTMAGLMMLAMAGAATAQEATPAGEEPNLPSEGFPVAIHEGTCAEPTAEPAFEIGDAVSVPVGESEEVETVGEAVDTLVLEVGTTLDGAIQDFADPPHAVAVHASPDEFGTVVACGQIAGTIEEGRLVVGLVPVGDSTVTGIVMFESVDDQVEVIAYIYNTILNPDIGDSTPAPEATPVS